MSEISARGFQVRRPGVSDKMRRPWCRVETGSSTALRKVIRAPAS